MSVYLSIDVTFARSEPLTWRWWKSTIIYYVYSLLDNTPKLVFLATGCGRGVFLSIEPLKAQYDGRQLLLPVSRSDTFGDVVVLAVILD